MKLETKIDKILIVGVIFGRVGEGVFGAHHIDSTENVGVLEGP